MILDQCVLMCNNNNNKITSKLSDLGKLLLSLSFCGSGIQAWGDRVLPVRVSDKIIIKLFVASAVSQSSTKAVYASKLTSTSW